MALPEPTTRVFRGTIAYAAGGVIQRTIGFLLLPVYARVLTTAEYGQIGVLMTLVVGLTTLLGLGLETAVFRTYVQLREQPGDLKRFVNSVGAFAVVAPLAVAAVLAIAASPLLERVFDVPRWAVTVGFLGAAMYVSATVIPLAILRAQERLRDYLRLSMVYVVATVALTVLLVVLLRWGVLGWMLAFAGAAAILLLTGLLMLGHPWTIRMDWKHVAAALAFGLPMIPHALAQWGLSLSDRAILAAFLPLTDVGIYYVAYQFGLPISVIAIALSQAVQPLYAQASMDHVSRAQLAPAASTQILTTALITMIVVLLGPPAVHAFLPGSYAPAASLIPWIALGHGLFGLYFIPMNAVTLLSGRNQWVWLVTVTAALANIGLNLLFVPRFGAVAAAVNTCVGYAILLIGVTAYMYRVTKGPVSLQWSRIGAGLAIVILATGPAMLLTAENGPGGVIIRLAAIAVVTALFGALGLIGGPLALLRIRRQQPALKP
jgi:O-antigen/teichoic acid export membrane protein